MCAFGGLAAALLLGTRSVRAAESDVQPPATASSSARPTLPDAAPSAEQQSGAPAGDAGTAPTEVLITGTRTPRRSRDSPASTTVLSRADLDKSPAKTSDELLRSVPSFGLFRRSSSLAADPSSQGVNLRGIGPSGVSRSLVLRDGLPLNDPFGGWVYWRAIPTLGIGRIEVAPGGGSALYGNYALGGVTQIFSRPITPMTLDVVSEGGSFATLRLSAFGSHREGVLGAAVDAELFRSDGYPVVADYARGPVDGDTPSSHAVVNGRVEVQATKDLVFSTRAGFFHEDQNGGTRYTTSTVRTWELSATARYTPPFGVFELSGFERRGVFEQDRARVTEGRREEFLAAQQHVPAQEFGGTVLWTSRPLRSPDGTR